MRATTIALVLFCAAVAAAASFGDMLVFDRQAFPVQYTKLGKAASHELMQVKFALQQRNLDALEDIYWDVTNPKSINWGNFLTAEEILDIIAPPQADHDRVVDFLVSKGVFAGHITSHRDSLTVLLDVATAEELFSTKMYKFTMLTSGKTIIRQLGEWYIPREIRGLVELVTGVSDFPMPRESGLKKAAINDANVVPTTLRNMYSIPASAKVTNAKSSAGVAEFGAGEGFAYSDLATFYQQTGITTTNITSDHIFGTNGSPGTESSLDIEYITAIGVDATNWFWTEPNWLYEFGNDLFNTKNIPYILSVSYGWSEVAQCQITTDCSTLGLNSTQYVARVNTEFQKVGLRGVSLIVASGDSGANGRTDGGCQDSQLHPTYPAASPFVTAVGATQLNNPTQLQNAPPVCQSNGPCAASGTEVAVSYAKAGFASGGGFSVVANRPAFQDDAVTNFLKTSSKLPPSSYFNANGRAYPDVAADGHNFLINQFGSWMPVGGTSAASPTFAGVMALLNSIKLTKTGKPLGPLNQFLYQMADAHPSAFNDIVVGDNICTEDGCASTCKGFTAQKGWDPVTGLGSPNYPQMVAYLNTLMA